MLFPPICFHWFSQGSIWLYSLTFTCIWLALACSVCFPFFGRLRSFATEIVMEAYPAYPMGRYPDRHSAHCWDRRTLFSMGLYACHPMLSNAFYCYPMLAIAFQCSPIHSAMLSNALQNASQCSTLSNASQCSRMPPHTIHCIAPIEFHSKTSEVLAVSLPFATIRLHSSPFAYIRLYSAPFATIRFHSRPHSIAYPARCRSVSIGLE